MNNESGMSEVKNSAVYIVQAICPWTMKVVCLKSKIVLYVSTRNMSMDNESGISEVKKSAVCIVQAICPQTMKVVYLKSKRVLYV